jgi:hypothetical protein
MRRTSATPSRLLARPSVGLRLALSELRILSHLPARRADRELLEHRALRCGTLEEPPAPLQAGVHTGAAVSLFLAAASEPCRCAEELAPRGSRGPSGIAVLSERRRCSGTLVLATSCLHGHWVSLDRRRQPPQLMAATPLLGEPRGMPRDRARRPRGGDDCHGDRAGGMLLRLQSERRPGRCGHGDREVHGDDPRAGQPDRAARNAGVVGSKSRCADRRLAVAPPLDRSPVVAELPRAGAVHREKERT